MRYTIEVTQEDITLGGLNYWNCPVHRAVKRATGFPYIIGWVSVYRDHFMGQFVAKLPDEAVKFITALHDGKGVRPFSFTLDLADEVSA